MKKQNKEEPVPSDPRTIQNTAQSEEETAGRNEQAGSSGPLVQPDEDIIHNIIRMPTIADAIEPGADEGFGVDLGNPNATQGGCFRFVRFCSRAMCQNVPDSPSKYIRSSRQAATRSTSLAVTERRSEESNAPQLEMSNIQAVEQVDQQQPGSSESRQSPRHDTHEPEPTDDQRPVPSSSLDQPPESSSSQEQPNQPLESSSSQDQPPESSTSQDQPTESISSQGQPPESSSSQEQALESGNSQYQTHEESK